MPHNDTPTASGASGPRTVRAPRGTTLSCKGWQQEAAMRMIMNNLDPEVAERPNDLVVYGGSGRAARYGPPPFGVDIYSHRLAR